MNFFNRGILFLLLLSGVAACKKESEHPQWDVEVLGPIAKASIGIHNLVSDTFIHADADGFLRIHYDTTFSAFELDSIYRFNDTTLVSSQVFPPFPSPITPGTNFPSSSNFIRLNGGNVQLKRAIIREGTIRITIKNILQSKILFHYTIPKAIKNGQPFQIVASVDSASPANPKYFTQDYDFSGFDLDLTGNAGNQTNLITYDVVSTSDPQGQTFTINASDTILNVQTTLMGIKPSYVKGYLGQSDINLTTNANFGIGEFIKGGMIEVDSVKLQIDLVNYIGADGQAFLTSLQSTNSTTANNVDLIAPSLINQAININRAVDLGTSSQPSQRTFILDKSNSNITDWVSNIPDRYSYNLNVNINPQGNISGGNDFIYSDQLLKTRLQFFMPLRMGLNQVMFLDSLDLNLGTDENFDGIGESKFTLVADNGFPFDIDLRLILVDDNNVVTDTLLVPGLIAAAPTDANKIVTQPRQTRLVVPVDGQRKSNLLAAKRMRIQAHLTSPNYPELYPLYDQYKLNIKLIADGIYSIR